MRLIDADNARNAKFPTVPEGISEVYVKGWNDAIDAVVENAQTVTPNMAQVLAYESGKSSDRPQGKWIREDKPWGGFGDRVLVLTCSECGESFIYHGNNPKFCSDCGASMKGGEGDV